MSILYPPIVDTYMPAFTGTNCTIAFSIPSLNNINEMSSKMVVSIVDQKTNQSVLKNGITLADRDSENKIHINLTNDVVKETIKINTFYKVQLKFIEKNKGINVNNIDSTWLTKNNQYCSEWSTVCLIKRILSPTISLSGYPETGNNNPKTPTIWAGMNGIFAGSVDFGALEDGEKETETLKSFRIKAYNNNQLVMDSGEQYTSNNRNPNEFQYISNYSFQDGETYSLYITCTTQYDYIETKKYYFTLIQYYHSNMPIINWNIQSEDELGRMKVEMSSEKNFIGSFVIRRTSNKSNYSFWEDVHFGFYIGEDPFHYTWYDYTIENGYFYKYCVQALTKTKNNNKTLITRSRGQVENDGKTVHLASFNSTYLVGDEIQLNIKYNTQISSLSKIVQESKIETLGSKYPFIRKNGNIEYKEFSLSGLITLYMDELNEPLVNIYDSTDTTKFEQSKNDTHTFASYNNVFQFSPDAEVEKKTLSQYNEKNNISKQNDIIYEQKFRDKVLYFLQNNQVKLFKSPTEGNILVKLMNISLDPVDGLNRHLYNFSCTATEIDDFNLLNCDKYNVQCIGEYKDISLEGEVKSLFVQETGSFTMNDNICQKISDRFLYKTTESLQNNFQYLNYIRIEFESPPQLIYINRGISPEFYTDNVKKIYPNIKPFLGYIINVNGNSIVVDERGIFELGGDDVNITSLYIRNATALVNCNAIFKTSPRRQKVKSHQWLESNIGQLEGNFTSKDTLIKYLINKYYFDNGKTYQQINAINELTIEADPGVVCYIQDFNEQIYNRHVIGPTGILTVFDDSIEPFDSQNNLVKDLYFKGLHFNKLTPSQKDIAALYNGYIDYNEYINSTENPVYFTSFDKIPILIPNCVYFVRNEEGIYKRYIYYNSQWYILDNNDDIQLDKIYAMVTYVYVKERGVYVENES